MVFFRAMDGFAMVADVDSLVAEQKRKRVHINRIFGSLTRLRSVHEVTALCETNFLSDIWNVLGNYDLAALLMIGDECQLQSTVQSNFPENPFARQLFISFF